MKAPLRLIITMLVFSFSYNCEAQNIYLRYINKPLDYPSGRPRILVIPLKDGNSLVLGSQHGYKETAEDTCYSITAIWLDKKGLPFKHKQYKSPFSPHDYMIATSLSNGDFVFAIPLYDTTGRGKWVGYLTARCNINGSLLWAKQIKTDVNKDVTPAIIKETPDGGCVIESSYYVSASPNGARVHLIWLSKNGTMTKHYSLLTYTQQDDPYQYFYTPYCLNFTKEGGLLLGGNKNCQICEGYHANTASIIKVDNKGKVVYSKNISDAGIDFLIDSANLTIAYGGFKITFSDTATVVRGLAYESYNVLFFNYLKNHPNLLPFGFSSGDYYDTDMSYVGTRYGYNGTKYYNNYVYRADSLGRKCPDYVPEDRTIKGTYFEELLLTDHAAPVLNTETTVADLPLQESKYFIPSSFYCTDAPIATIKH